MTKIKLLFLSCLLFIITKQTFSQLPIPYRDDFNEYWELINAYYPSENYKKITPLKDSLLAVITPTTSLLEFYSYLSFFNSQINCVHTDVSLPKSEKEILRKQSIFLPYFFRITTDSIFILINKNYYNVLRINGEKSSILLKKIRNHLKSDNNIYYKNYVINNSFPALYSLYINQIKKYSIELKDTTVDIEGITHQNLLKIYRENINYLPNLYQSKLFIDSNIAYLNISSFGITHLRSKKINAKKIIDTFFREVRAKKIQRIILDLRNNTGGQADIPMSILKWLAETPYSFYEKIRYKNNNYTPYFNLTESSFTTDGNYYRRKKTFEYTKQKKVFKDYYDGTVYILINGANVSMAVAFIKKITNVNKNIILIGQPVGGNFNFNAGIYVKKELENSKIKVKIPIEKIEVDSTQSNYIITPDLYIEDSQFIDNTGKIIFLSLINIIKQHNLWDGKP